MRMRDVSPSESEQQRKSSSEGRKKPRGVEEKNSSDITRGKKEMKDKLQAKSGRDHDSKESKTTMKKEKTKRNYSSVIKDKNISSAL